MTKGAFPPVLVQVNRAERGISLAWTAVLFAFVLVPLLILTLDGTRLFYVRNRLQTATDAACEDAAWTGADILVFQQTGQTALRTDWYPLSVAQATFSNVTHDAGIIQYSPVVQISVDAPRVSMICAAQATVPLLVGNGTVVIHAASVSAIRFGNQ